MKARLEGLHDEKLQDDPDFAEQLIAKEDAVENVR